MPPSHLVVMLLILTNSLDGTADEIVRRVGVHRVFRFNIDLWRDYEISLDTRGFILSDPSGRFCRSSDIRAAYLRKPTFDDPITIPEGGCQEDWLRAQMSYFLQEVYNWCRDNHLVRLVEKGAQQRFGKFSQLRLAQDYFAVPPWVFVRTSNPIVFTEPCITKPLTADFIGDYKLLFTRSVDPSSLDPEYPWLLQEEVAATHDVTVVYVAGRSFAFALDRSSFEGIDWRTHINRHVLAWQPWPLTDDFENRIHKFMGAAGLDFGRLDFLADPSETYFLEVNPNGQWAWLDEDGSRGIFDTVVHELTKGWSAV